MLRDLIRDAQDREDAGYSPEVVAAIERAMVNRKDESRFIDHETAMARLDTEIEAVAKLKS